MSEPITGISISTGPTGGLNPLRLLMEQRAKLNGQPSEPEQLKKAAQNFESVLINILMNEMQKTVPDSGFLSDATTKQVQGLFWQFLSQEMADNGGIGLAKDLYRDFCQMANIDPDATNATTDILK
ncbi:MAG: rod-binding protein [Phycisphaerae bacterium]|nr:rod-binding protein [Phycisphaerae bacterium]